MAYTTYCSSVESKSRVSIYEFLPRPDDPTPQEVEKIKAKEQNRYAAGIQRKAAAARKRFEKLGLLKIE